jgi:DNA-binding MarR family transcriptional regulator
MKSIQDELKRVKPFPTKGAEVTVALIRTASILRRGLEEELSQFDITLQQFNVLRILRGAKEPLPTMEIGTRMIEREPGITRLINRIESKGLVTRKRCPEDARRIWVEISKEGLALLDRIGEPADWGIQHSVDALSDSESDALLSSLNKIRAALSE